MSNQVNPLTKTTQDVTDASRRSKSDRKGLAGDVFRWVMLSGLLLMIFNFVITVGNEIEEKFW